MKVEVMFVTDVKVAGYRYPAVVSFTDGPLVRGLLKGGHVVLIDPPHLPGYNDDEMSQGPSVPNAWISPPVTPEPVAPEPILPEPITPEPITPEPIFPEPVTPDPIVPDPVFPEPIVPEPVAPQPVVPEPVFTEPPEPENQEKKTPKRKPVRSQDIDEDIR